MSHEPIPDGRGGDLATTITSLAAGATTIAEVSEEIDDLLDSLSADPNVSTAQLADYFEDLANRVATSARAARDDLARAAAAPTRLVDMVDELAAAVDEA